MLSDVGRWQQVDPRGCKVDLVCALLEGGRQHREEAGPVLLAAGSGRALFLFVAGRGERVRTEKGAEGGGTQSGR